MTIELTQLTKENGEKIQHVKDDVKTLLSVANNIQESLEDLVNVPSKLDVVSLDTKAIMADLVTTRREHVDANNRLTDALIKLGNRVALGLFIVMLLCMAGFFGRNLVLGSGNNTAAFTQPQQDKNE